MDLLGSSETALQIFLYKKYLVVLIAEPISYRHLIKSFY